MGLLEQAGRYIFKREAYRAYRGVMKNTATSSKPSSIFYILGIGTWVFVALFIAIALNTYMFLFVIPFLFTFYILVKQIRGYFRKSRNIYGTVPITKSDRRFKRGYRIIGTKTVVTGKVLLTDLEIPIFKAAFKKEIIKWIIVNSILIIGIIITHFIKY